MDQNKNSFSEAEENWYILINGSIEYMCVSGSKDFLFIFVSRMEK